MSRSLGPLGEETVALYLKKEGFSILERNYRIRGGEIDIIARKNDLIAFVEVKTRLFESSRLSEVVTPSKQSKIIFTARYFLLRNQLQDVTFRFDIALVEGHDLRITYIPNAFTEQSW